MPNFKSIASFIAVPSNFLLLLLLVGFVLLLLQRYSPARLCLAISVTGFLVFGYTSAGELLFAPLDSRFPARDPATAPPPHGLIVLHSNVNEVHALAKGTAMEFGDGGEAIVTAALLARRFPNARIIVSGGTPIEPPLREGDGMKRILTIFGTDPNRISMDATSGSTVEAVYTILDLMQPDRDKTWWLITSAHRMPRAIGTFRQAGFEPMAFPVDFRWVPPFDPLYVYSFHEGLQLTDNAVHEWLGLFVYWLTGRTKTFFPEPDSA